MKLHTYFRSSAAFRVRFALNLKGLAYEAAFVHLAKGEHRAPAYGTLNPQALVPALDDGGTLLTQSLATSSTWRRRARRCHCCPGIRRGARACARSHC